MNYGKGGRRMLGSQLEMGRYLRTREKRQVIKDDSRTQSLAFLVSSNSPDGSSGCPKVESLQYGGGVPTVDRC